MLRTHLHRRGQIPTAVHPFEKAAMAGQPQPQPQPKTFWVYRFIFVVSVAPFAMLKFVQRQFYRHI